MTAARWTLVKSQGHTVYHHRRLAGDAWCTVAQRDGHRWEWAVRVRAPGEVTGEAKADGVCSTWRNARRAADEAAAKLGLT